MYGAESLTNIHIEMKIYRCDQSSRLTFMYTDPGQLGVPPQHGPMLKKHEIEQISVFLVQSNEFPFGVIMQFH